MKPRYLLDTHALVWAVQDTARLGAKARRILETSGKGEVVISSHTVVELGRLIHVGAVETDGPPSKWFAPVLSRFPVLPATLEAAIKAPVLALPHGDPFDRLIVAEALMLGVPLITKDGNITDSGIVRVVW